jgi:hypothetical protein
MQGAAASPREEEFDGPPGGLPSCPNIPREPHCSRPCSQAPPAASGAGRACPAVAARGHRGHLREVHQARLLQRVRQEREQGQIGPQDCAHQHEAQYRGSRRITLGVRRVHANTPLCSTPVTGTVVRVRRSVRGDGAARSGSGLRMHV